MNQQKFYLLIFLHTIFLDGIIKCVASFPEITIASSMQQVSDSAQATSTYPRLNSASAPELHYGTHSSTQPHLGQPHHYRHHNNPNLKIMSPGSLSSSPEHVNPHQVPELLKPLLLDKSNIKTSADSASRQTSQTYHLKSASSSASTIDVDSFVPSGYDKLMPPKENGKPTIVRFHVWVLGLDSIDEGSMTYVADIFISQSWKDNRLIIPKNITFNVNVSANNDPRGPYRLLPVTLIDKIWRPDSFFKNAKEVTFQEMTIPNHYIWLYEDHTILYMVKLSLLLSCAMKFQTYPHDTQNCTMKIESLSYTTNDLIFDWEESDPLVVEKNIELPQHDLIKKEIDYCTTTYSSGTFACVQVLFTIKRRLGYYIFHTYIPTCLIVIMSWISFWIKPEAVPARVTLCVTSLLTLSTQHAQSQKSLPPVSYIKAIDIFMSSCTVFVFASLMEYALVNILMSDELLNGWIGIMGEAGGPMQAAAAVGGGSSALGHVADTPQAAAGPVGLLPSRPSPLIHYSQQSAAAASAAPACEACCTSARQSTSSEAANDGEEEDSLENDAAEEVDEEAVDIHLGRKAMPKLNATSISLLPANSLQHRASFQCLTELTANVTNRNFDPYGTSVFKLNSLNVKPKTANRPPNNILSNRKNPKLSGHSKSTTVNLAVNDQGKGTRMRRLSQSFSLLKMINQPKEKFGSAVPCTESSISTSPPQHHAHYCPQSQFHETAAALHFRHSSQQSRPIGRLLHYTNSSASDTCFHHHHQQHQQHHQQQQQHQQAPAGITLQSAGCCGSGSTTNGFGGANTAGFATGGRRKHHTASSYQQKKHMRAYVVDEISRWIFPLSFIMLNIVYWAYYLNLMDSLPEFSQH